VNCLLRIFRILVVCTGNLCRSPAAERLLGDRLVKSKESRFELDSAGTAIVPGTEMHPLTAAALRARRVPCDGHVAKPLSEGLIGRADLVLTAERSHRTEVVARLAGSSCRTFTIGEFSRLAGPALRAGALDPWDLVAAAASMRVQIPLEKPGADDIPDPVKGTVGDHQAVVGLLDRCVQEIAEALEASASPRVLGGMSGDRSLECR
jgi:protein-tyrosine phosphatase